MNKNGKLVTTNEEKDEVLHIFFLQSSLATSLPTPLKWVDCKIWTGGEKSLPLQEKIRFVTT